MYLQFYFIVILYGISQNFIHTQDFFQAQLSPFTLTSVPYLDGEVAVYEHKQNRSRLFVPPLAVVYLNQTRVFYNTFTSKYMLTLSLILYTNELRTKILKYVSSTRGRCIRAQEICDLKMVPTERLRIVWKRTNPLLAAYKLDTSWQSNTALRNKIDVHIECTTSQICYKLLNDLLEAPFMLDGFELEYSTQPEKQTCKIVTITGQHLMKTKMYSELKQLPSATVDDSIRYLLVDDMNQLITEILTTMELEEVTDSDYIAHDDQKALTELLTQRLSLNVETLHDHTEQQWNSIYWNSDIIRPDRIVRLLNDELKQLQNKTITTYQNKTYIEQQRDQNHFNQTYANGNYDISENISGSGRNKTDRSNDGTSISSTQKQIIDQSSSDQSQIRSYRKNTSDNYHNAHSFNNNFGINTGFGGFSVGVSFSPSNTHKDSSSLSRSNYGINDWCNAFSKFSDYSHNGSNARKNKTTSSDDISFDNKNAWRHVVNQDQQTVHDHIEMKADAESYQNFRHKNFDFYTKNRQYIEFTGDKFIVKPVKAYKLNLATFQENTKLIHRSIVVTRIDSIHAVPIRKNQIHV
ncbi:unnamed protein product [Rotaria sp. Silwood1]|nr:unnamed protein product [Rotaria sp. Silwood1]